MSVVYTANNQVVAPNVLDTNSNDSNSQEALTALPKENEELKARNQELEGRLTGKSHDFQLFEIAHKNNVVDVNDAMYIFNQSHKVINGRDGMRIEQNGKPLFSKKRSGEYATLEEAFETWLAGKPHFVKGYNDNKGTSGEQSVAALQARYRAIVNDFSPEGQKEKKDILAKLGLTGRLPFLD